MSVESGDISTLATAAFDFAAATLVLATIATVILQTLHEFGLRMFVNKRALNAWFKGRLPEGRSFDVTKHIRSISFLNLPYRQLCGQLNAALNADVVAGKLSNLVKALAHDDLAHDNTDVDPRSRPDEREVRLQVLAVRAEQGIDELQEYLGSWWIRLNYLFALAIIILIIGILIYTPNPFEPTSGDVKGTQVEVMLVAVGVVAGSIVPLGLRLLERFFSAR